MIFILAYLKPLIYDKAKVKKEKILIVGSGAREHALGYKLSPFVELFFAPGNVGTASIGTNIPIAETAIHQLAVWVKKNNIDFTVVGPDAPIAQGIATVFQKMHLPIFAPTKKAARLESSKIYSAKFVEKYHIPHPESVSFTNVQKALEYIAKKDPQKIVIKADGLALGKGVVLPESRQEAEQAVKEMMVLGKFGKSGTKIVVQEKVVGQEVSVLAFSDGKTIVPLPPAQDHKKIFTGDRGPNTGGMGTYTPVKLVTKRLMKVIHQTILQPTIDGMRKEKAPFQGLLFTGLMLTKKGPMVLEYNARFGDPETQSVLLLLKDNLLGIMKSCMKGTLHKSDVRCKKAHAIAIVLAAKGYPQTPEKGRQILGLEKIHDPQVVIFQAATSKNNGKLVTNGGRVLSICAVAPTAAQAAKKAYASIGKKRVHFSGMHYRKDIALEHPL